MGLTSKWHYMSVMASLANWLYAQHLVRGLQLKDISKFHISVPLRGESVGGRWSYPTRRACNAESVSMQWRDHDRTKVCIIYSYGWFFPPWHASCTPKLDWKVFLIPVIKLILYLPALSLIGTLFSTIFALNTRYFSSNYFSSHTLHGVFEFQTAIIMSCASVPSLPK